MKLKKNIRSLVCLKYICIVSCCLLKILVTNTFIGHVMIFWKNCDFYMLKLKVV
jgi:hypothetical protein